MKLSLHEQLKLLRMEKKLTIEELSMKTQLGIEKLTAYETGEQIPSKQSLFVLSTILDVPVSNLVDGLK
ncbi:helix-turn-helix domain-containing protein [Solibacillus daqui]|uniref:helix-turn-helix domain-containing protein n=1 Tax=Solibacillus daqui TaxID=2912187 RepID=UPI0023658A12|nr:helix-turn-helix transcriptional regulator [Solibacillus daqui]